MCTCAAGNRLADEGGDGCTKCTWDNGNWPVLSLDVLQVTGWLMRMMTGVLSLDVLQVTVWLMRMMTGVLSLDVLQVTGWY